MSSFICSLTQNLFIFAVLIHMVVLIDNQALINIHLYYFSYFFPCFSQCFNLENIWCGKIVLDKRSCPVLYQVQLRIFSFAIWLHFITHINMWVFSS